MAVPVHLSKIFKCVDDNQQQFINVLREAVAIKSVIAPLKMYPEILRMINWTKTKLESLGATCYINETGTRSCRGTGGGSAPLQTLTGQFGHDPKKKTLCIYGHFDCQPASKRDGWNTEPFELVKKRGKLYGRGSASNKGPIIGWINAIDAFQKVGQEIPVNIKFILEGYEENGPNDDRQILKDECLDNPNNAYFRAGLRAYQLLYGMEPDLTREDGDIPVSITFQPVIERYSYSPKQTRLVGFENVMLLPMGPHEDGAHWENEMIDLRNFIQGTKLFAAFINEIASNEIPTDKAEKIKDGFIRKYIRGVHMHFRDLYV
ncbi:unnamed protein product [Meganyctiphanes norvegica]|uniref:Uncharacterized protein n=1 Tax=Meganyctiphanes norvegica TaxID=48144 RepID=A0AAV2S7D1_MEGNR